MNQPQPTSASQKHAISIDVECYYQIFLRNSFSIDIAPTTEVYDCTNEILDLLLACEAKATFFVVGNVANAFPVLVERIVGDGHELASHGDAHVYVNRITRAQFRDDLRRSKNTLEAIAGSPVRGFRAPQFSIDRSTPWAYDVLAEEGFTYDSSTFPFRGRSYGDPKAPREPWTIETDAGPIREIPLTTVEMLGMRIPAAGGGYLRYFPYWVTSGAIKLAERSGRSAVIYLHPYEFAFGRCEERLEKELERAAWKTKLSHRMQLFNRRNSFSKVSRLARQFRLSSIADTFRL